MGNEAELNLAGLVQAFGVVVSVSIGIAALALLTARAMRLPTLPVRGQDAGLAVWPGAAIIGLFAVYFLLELYVIPLLDAAGVYQKLCGPTFPKLPRIGTDALAAAGGGLIEHAETNTRSGQHQLRRVWASFLFVPAMVGLVLLLWRPLLDRPPKAGAFARDLPGRIVFGVAAGIVVIPVCFAVNLLTMWVAQQAEAGVDQHPLTILILSGDAQTHLVVGLSILLFVPILEELLFRGSILGWAEAEWYRPWVVMVFAGFLSSLRGTASVPETGPLAFLAFLGVGLYLMQRFAFDLWPRFPTRTAAAVWSSSALFAVAHSGVWPSPIPLFAFALGLGYLTARTRDITTAVVVHGMFNAVSFVYLLRGGS